MAFVEWSEDLDVGSAEMNAQHRRLISIINRYHDALESGASNAALADIFGEVAQYARMHFQAEERLMEEHGFPSLRVHRTIHEQLLKRVTETLPALRNATGDQVKNDVQYFLRHWLTAHIKGIDTKYRAYVEAAQPGVRPGSTAAGCARRR